MKTKPWTLVMGTDPEFFISTFGEDGLLKVVPPAKLRYDFDFPTDNSNVKHPLFATADGQNGKVRLIEDGGAFEVNLAPSTNIESLFQDVQLGYQLGRDIAAQFGYDISVIPAIKFDTNEFKNRTEEFQMTLIFGCDPDQNVYVLQGKLEANDPLEDAMNHPLRYAGGHWHMSGCPWLVQKWMQSVKIEDIVLGNLLTFMSPMKDLDKIRTYRYGRPGNFRLQNYASPYKDYPYTDEGIEWRPASCSWTTDLKLARMMAESSYVLTHNILGNDRLMEEIIGDLEDLTIKAILTGDAAQAEANYNAVMGMAG